MRPFNTGVVVEALSCGTVAGDGREPALMGPIGCISGVTSCSRVAELGPAGAAMDGLAPGEGMWPSAAAGGLEAAAVLGRGPLMMRPGSRYEILKMDGDRDARWRCVSLAPGAGEDLGERIGERMGVTGRGRGRKMTGGGTFTERFTGDTAMPLLMSGRAGTGGRAP